MARTRKKDQAEKKEQEVERITEELVREHEDDAVRDEPKAKKEKKERKLKHPPLSAADAKKLVARTEPGEGECLCMCGGTPKGKFLPGHDSRLLSMLKATLASDDAAAKREARKVISNLGWESK